MSDTLDLASGSTSMFSREIDWTTATSVICDVMRGSSVLEMETHVSVDTNGCRQPEISRWRYEQTQAFQTEDYIGPRLFSSGHLRDRLLQMADNKMAFAYEVDPSVRLGTDVAKALAEFSSIAVSHVTLTVGVVNLSWLVVKLGQPRDLLLWKMRYHLRQAVL